MRCAVRFWSSESETEFVYVFIVFFLLLCVLGLSPFTKKPAEQGGQREKSLEGTAPGPLWKQARGGREAENAQQQKKDYENIYKFSFRFRAPEPDRTAQREQIAKN